MADLALDRELRAAVFAHIANLRARYGGRIPTGELNLGIQFRGERVPIWNYQKGIFKPKALGHDGAALSIQTSIESPYQDSRDSDGGHFVYKYRGKNPDQPDNLALRKAMEWQRPLLYLVAVDPGFYDAIMPILVISDDPTSLQVELVVDPSFVHSEDAAAPIVTARREYATRAVMERLHQQKFRRVVLKAYGEHCAICRLGHATLLDAAHILADRHPLGEPVVSNGLGLCKIHHSAYDANILGIDPNAEVHIKATILEERDGSMLKHGLQEIHGSRLVLPRRVVDRPNQAFLEERFSEFLAA